MENVNCLHCRFRHEDNGNCTAVGGFCTAVPAAHCPLLRQYLDTGMTPEEVLPKDKADEIALKLMRLSDLESLCSYDRLQELAEADKDGRVVVPPVDRGILLRDILETGAVTWKEKAYTLRASAGTKQGVSNILRHIETNGKFGYMGVAEPVRIGTIENDAKDQSYDSQQYRVYSPDGKSVTLCGNGGGLGAKTGLYATPVAPPMRVREATKQGYVDIYPGECVDMAMPQSKTRRGRAMREKTNCLTTSCEMYEYCGTLDKPIYQVRDGRITIKGKDHPIKLRDGCYIIRKLTVRECMRLQTVPEEYVFPVSDSQAYKMLGNGWTVDVIAHIMSHFTGLTEEPVEVLSMYDGMSCGHIALDKLGAEITAYYATEIDKYAIQTTQHNFPDTVQLGDAFQVRDESWSIARAMAEQWGGSEVKDDGVHNEQDYDQRNRL